MASSMVHENWGFINGQDDAFDELEVSEIDTNLLTSLLDDEESECDDERLTNVIRSLEAEISPIMIDGGHDSVMNLEWDGCNFADDQVQMNDQGYCSTSDGLDFNWMEMDDMSMAYLQPCEEFEGVRDYHPGQISSYALMSLEEHGYDSLWQETNASVV